MDPQTALEKLMAGNQRFAAGNSQKIGDYTHRRQELIPKQSPFATVLTCSDSRVNPAIVFDQSLGDLFVIRVAGNTLDDLVLGSIHFSVGVLKTPLVMVMGHQNCGAVQAALEKKATEGWIAGIVRAIQPVLKNHGEDSTKNLKAAVQANVYSVVQRLRQDPKVFSPLVQSGKVLIQGAYYDFNSGRVNLLSNP